MDKIPAVSSAIVVLLTTILTLTSAAPEYQFSFGRIQGVDEQAEDTLKPYDAYYGIPFAQPPVGALRFRAPRPFVNGNTNTVISSQRLRSACVQSQTYNDISEDCLYLNVYSPPFVNNGGSLKKVMVWIHGGGYTLGSAKEYIPSRMVTDYDIIVVTLQYRLGLLGFLNAGAGKETNFGLRDQIMGIQWVKDNIRQFGGDGNDITIFGESAGASSVSLLSLSPLTKGLFTKVIMQSGTATSAFATNSYPEKEFIETAGRLGCTSWFHQLSFLRGKFVDDILDCLRRKPALDIIQRNYETSGGGTDNDDDSKVLSGMDIYATFFDNPLPAPTVDGIVIPRNPQSLLADRTYLQTNGVLDRSYVMGFNNNEGIMMLVSEAGKPDYAPFEDPDQAEKFVRTFAGQVFQRPVTDYVTDFVAYEYTYPRGNDGKTDVMNIIKVFRDLMFAVPTVQFARAIASASSRTPIYMYLFDHYPELVDPNPPVKGSIHALDLAYEFDRSSEIEKYISFYAKIYTPTDQPLYNIVRSSFTEFAKTGVPSSNEYSAWPRFRLTDESYLAIQRNPEVRQMVFAKQMDLWTKVLPKRAGEMFQSRPVRLY